MVVMVIPMVIMMMMTMMMMMMMMMMMIEDRGIELPVTDNSTGAVVQARGRSFSPMISNPDAI